MSAKQSKQRGRSSMLTGLGPVDVVYLDRDEDVHDMRYLIVLFQGEKGSLFDRVAGSTTVIELDDRGLTGDERLGAKLEGGKAAASKAKLSKVYVEAPMIAKRINSIYLTGLELALLGLQSPTSGAPNEQPSMCRLRSGRTLLPGFPVRCN
jgi:hypothetical protein